MPVSGKGQGQGESCEGSGLLLPHHQDPQLGKWGSNETSAVERQPERPSLLPVPFLSPSCQPPASALALCARVHAEPYRHMPRSSRGTWILPTPATVLRLQPLLPGELIQLLALYTPSLYHPYPRFTSLDWNAPLNLQAWNEQPPCHLPQSPRDSPLLSVFTSQQMTTFCGSNRMCQEPDVFFGGDRQVAPRKRERTTLMLSKCSTTKLQPPALTSNLTLLSLYSTSLSPHCPPPDLLTPWRMRLALPASPYHSHQSSF